MSPPTPFPQPLHRHLRREVVQRKAGIFFQNQKAFSLLRVVVQHQIYPLIQLTHNFGVKLVKRGLPEEFPGRLTTEVANLDAFVERMACLLVESGTSPKVVSDSFSSISTSEMLMLAAKSRRRSSSLIFRPTCLMASHRRGHATGDIAASIGVQPKLLPATGSSPPFMSRARISTISAFSLAKRFGLLHALSRRQIRCSLFSPCLLVARMSAPASNKTLVVAKNSSR